MQNRYAVDYKTAPPAWHAWAILADSPEQALRIVASISGKPESMLEVRGILPN